jgi:tRNA threonylcarbamoyladenosine biosynthesis protein TsaB
MLDFLSMRILALETATLAGSVALLDGGRVTALSLLDIALTHSERLMAMVDGLLENCGWDISGLDALAVSVGPGSFTGLRVGIATVKGLALALALPVAAVPTLDALAANVPFADAPVCPLLDARKGEVYLSLYRWRGDRMERQWDYLALPPRTAAERLEPPIIVLGDGVPACLPFLSALGPGLRAAPASHAAPSAAVVGLLGHAMLRAGDTVPAESLQPLYLRPSEAELKARRA